MGPVSYTHLDVYKRQLSRPIATVWDSPRIRSPSASLRPNTIRHRLSLIHIYPILYIVIPCYNEEAVLPLTSGMFLKKIKDLAAAGKICLLYTSRCV